MSTVKWIKIVTDIFDDEKIKLIESMQDGNAYIVIWFKLLCLAGKANTNGLLLVTAEMSYTVDMLSVLFRIDSDFLRGVLSLFERFGMIEMIGETIAISNWEKHQNETGLEDIREYNRQKQRESRERRKLLAAHVIDTSMTCQEKVFDGQDTEEDKEIDKEIDKESEKSARTRARFIAPTVEEVKAYCTERGNHVLPERFVAYYTANGWKVGQNPMKDWKAAVRSWEKNGYNDQKPQPATPASYDIYRAEQKAKTSVPKLVKKQQPGTEKAAP